ncbi:hypothetical protein [Streptomyces sp. NBC_00459]|uniref:hypothetical protein n=1 Tax=Streptomyces sp. NBC_00459 TaxID=2975749 RepID=UPI002E16D093
MTIAFVMLRLLPMSDRVKYVEILVLRHRIGVLERQLNGQQVWFHAGERAFLASLSLPSITSVQLRPHSGTRGGCRRVGRVAVCRGGRFRPDR